MLLFICVACSIPVSTNMLPMNIPVFCICSTGSGISPPLQIKSCITNCHICIPVSSNLTCRLSLHTNLLFHAASDKKTPWVGPWQQS